MEEWRTVTAEHPCPVCKHKGWCTVKGNVAKCMRVESEKPVESGGWIHRLGGEVSPAEEVGPKKPDKPKLTAAELSEFSTKAYLHPRAEATRGIVADKLGVSVESLMKLKVGYGCDRDGKEYSTWPARHWKGHVVGVVRRYESGEKKSLYGGSTGLFYCNGWSQFPGPILIVEGGSDTAAGITLGLSMIGRPSNVGGADWIQNMLKARAAGRQVVVVGEHDEKPEKRGGSDVSTCKADCAGCGHCFPGRFGAEMVAKQLGCLFVMPPEGLKDFRDVAAARLPWEQIVTGVAVLRPSPRKARQ